MPEEAPAVQNWRLLIVACLLGLVVMVVYNLHINKVRRGLDVEMVAAYRYARDMNAGDKLDEDDLEQIKLPRQTAERIGKLLDKNDKAVFVEQSIRRNVSKSDFAMPEHFTHTKSQKSNYLLKGQVQITISVDSKKAPGRVLRIGDHVNIVGMLPMKAGTYKNYRIVEWLSVVAIGGQTDSGAGKMASASHGVRSYNSITVVIDRDVSLQWKNLETYLRGAPTIEICPSTHIPTKTTQGVISPELLSYTKQASGSSVGSGAAYDEEGY